MSKQSKHGQKPLDDLTKKDELEKSIKAFKAISLEQSFIKNHPDETLRLGAEKLKQLFQTDFKDEVLKKELETYMAKYAESKTLDTNLLLTVSVEEEHLPMVLDVIAQLTEEYKVVSPQDKAHVQMAAMAYSRYISDLYQFNSWKHHEYNSHERVEYMNMVSKDMDRAFRQYHAVVQYLEAKKNPPLLVNIKANTAFIAQNQQNVASSNQTLDETNDPQ